MDDDLRPGLAGLIVLGVVVAVFVLGYFVWEKITTGSGEIRYRFVIDVGVKPNGKRDQRCYTFTKLTDARTARAKIIADRKAGTLVRRTKITLGEAITAWLDGKRNLRVSTKRNYEDSLRLVSDRLGHVQLQHLTKAHWTIW